MQALVDVQVQGVDHAVPVEVRVDIVIGVPHARAMALLVQIEIQCVGTTVIIQIAVTQVAVAVAIGVELISVIMQNAIVYPIRIPVIIGIRVNRVCWDI